MMREDNYVYHPLAAPCLWLYSAINGQEAPYRADGSPSGGGASWAGSVVWETGPWLASGLRARGLWSQRRGWSTLYLSVGRIMSDPVCVREKKVSIWSQCKAIFFPISCGVTVFCLIQGLVPHHRVYLRWSVYLCPLPVPKTMSMSSHLYTFQEQLQTLHHTGPSLTLPFHHTGPSLTLPFHHTLGRHFSFSSSHIILVHS